VLRDVGWGRRRGWKNEGMRGVEVEELEVIMERFGSQSGRRYLSY